jgi:hypothetical protein
MDSVDKNIALCNAWLFVSSGVDKGEPAAHHLEINKKKNIF